MAAGPHGNLASSTRAQARKTAVPMLAGGGPAIGISWLRIPELEMHRTGFGTVSAATAAMMGRA
jgi:hypothetical protein